MPHPRFPIPFLQDFHVFHYVVKTPGNNWYRWDKTNLFGAKIMQVKSTSNILASVKSLIFRAFAFYFSEYRQVSLGYSLVIPILNFPFL